MAAAAAPVPAPAEGIASWARASVTTAIAITAAAISITAAFLSASISRRRSRSLESQIRDLEGRLAASIEEAAAERRGRVRTQQTLRNAVAGQCLDSVTPSAALPPPSGSYPMVPIGTVQSCFSFRYGTPRQPLLVPLARACLVFDQRRVSPESLEGLADFSHCWILYVFHLNTNLDKVWREPSRSKIKAKVRVPRLKGGRVGILATRSPHRPCPIGLTVAKIEAVDGRAVLVSGVDLVDGTPILDIKPYLSYSDSVKDANVPDWVKEDSLCVASVGFSADFHHSLSSCWSRIEKCSMYSSINEFQNLIKEVLSWDIRPLTQRELPSLVAPAEMDGGDDPSCRSSKDRRSESHESLSSTLPGNMLPGNTQTYHLVLEGVDISYKIDSNSNIVVEKASLPSEVKDSGRSRCSYSMWRGKLHQRGGS